MVRPNENPPQGTESPQDSPLEAGQVKADRPSQPVTVEPPPIDIRADIVEPDKKG